METPTRQTRSINDPSENEAVPSGVAPVNPPTNDQQRKERDETGAPAGTAGDNGVDPEVDWITGLPLGILMTALSIVMFLVLLDGSIIGTVSDRVHFPTSPIMRRESHPDRGQATPAITSEFHSLGDVGWYGAAFQLAR